MARGSPKLSRSFGGPGPGQYSLPIYNLNTTKDVKKLADSNDKNENSNHDKEEEDGDEVSSNDDYSAVCSMNVVQQEMEIGARLQK